MKSIKEKNTDFIFSIIHDIKAPILSMDVALRNLREKNEFLNEIYKTNLHNLNYIENLLKNYKFEEGKYQLKVQKINLVEIINEEFYLLKDKISIKNLKIRHKFHDLNCEVQNDEAQVRQIILNLVTNAVKFCKTCGMVEIATLKRADEIEISLTNSIDKDALEKQGNGMGQKIIQNALEIINGKITHQKNQDKIEFRLIVPNL